MDKEWLKQRSIKMDCKSGKGFQDELFMAESAFNSGMDYHDVHGLERCTDKRCGLKIESDGSNKMRNEK